jgi:LAO/AO transport system kinase
MNDRDINSLLQAAKGGDIRALARCISVVENELPGHTQLLESLPARNKSTFVTGITGPPGAGKSTLVNSISKAILEKNPVSRVAVLAVDPTSPFTHGSILGDRLRMTDHFNDPRVYIRSVATRGALGGLSVKTPQITDILLATGFDHILIETVGVGQSELEIAALADTTIVVFVPESGDDIQTIKSGIMEIADIFVVNKSDREGADRLARSITATLHERPQSSWQPPVVMTAASIGKGITELLDKVTEHHSGGQLHPHKQDLLLHKASLLLEQQLLRKVNVADFEKQLKNASTSEGFNIYQFVRLYIDKQF